MRFYIPIFLLPLLGLYACGNSSTSSPAAAPAASTTAVAPAADPLPELPEGGGQQAVLEAVQQGIVLPWGTPVPASNSRVVVQFVVGTVGEVAEPTIVQGLSPAVDQAVLTAVRTLRFRPVQRAGKYVPVPYTLTIDAPGVATPTQHREADTRRRQIARRLPGEADSTFVRRVLPLSYPEDEHSLMAYAWRPGAFGKQLFFSRRGAEGNDYGTDLFVLDPYQPDTYAVQVIPIGSMGDVTDLAALFFADADHDGRKDLLALAECSLRDGFEVDGEILMGRANHYRTDIWQYAGFDPAGRPQYRQDTTARPYLDELRTAAEVRDVLGTGKATPRK